MPAMSSIVDAAQARPLRWWSAAQLGAAADRLRAALTPWARDWDLELGDIGASNVSGQASSSAHEGVALAHAAACLQIDQGTPVERLRSVLFGLADPEQVHAAPTLAEEAAREAWGALVEALSSALPVHPAPAASKSSSTRWSGCVQLHATVVGAGNTLGLTLALQPAAAERWCTVPASPAGAAVTAVARAPLQQVDDVVADRPVRLAVHLTPAVLDLGSLQSLQVGDVLTLPHRIDQALDVAATLDASAADHPICKAHLGQRDGRLAIALAGKPSHH